MRAHIWGCRGSLAAPGPDTIRYGGNTSCVEVRLDDGTLIILDAGTGLRLLGLERAKHLPSSIHILLTHLHLDHLEGLGFFAPLWNPSTDLHIWGPASPTQSLEQRIERYFSPPLFPVHLRDVPSGPVFHDAPNGEWQLGSATVFSQPISHSGPTVGYRIEADGGSMAYMPDHEPMRGKNLMEVAPEWLSGHAIAERVDVLLHDSQYTEEEYPDRVGWGHSSTEQVVLFAMMARVGKLLMFHHDPTHSDEKLEAMRAHARELWTGDGDGPELASEGMEIDLSSQVKLA